MKAKLLAFTQVADYVEGIEDIQELIAYCAKVSNPEGQMNLETSARLLKYLLDNRHWSPLEMASITMEVVTTRDIARQFLRHRSFSFQEFSQRYSAIGDDDFVIREARLQHPTNRQDSLETSNEELQKMWFSKQKQLIHEAKLAYRWALDNGIAKEQARVVLPEGNTVSRLYVNGTVRSWLHYIELRSSNGTQKEHMELAREIGYSIAKIFPLLKSYIHE